MNRCEQDIAQLKSEGINNPVLWDIMRRNYKFGLEDGVAAVISCVKTFQRTLAKIKKELPHE